MGPLLIHPPGGVGGSLGTLAYLEHFSVILAELGQKGGEMKIFTVFPYKSPPQAEIFGDLRYKIIENPLKSAIFSST